MHSNSTPDFGPPGVAPPPNYPPNYLPNYPQGIAPPPQPPISIPAPIPSPILGQYPTVAVCPSCTVQMTTRTENENCCCCFFCDCCIEAVHHYCTNCNTFLGTYKN